MELKVVKVGSDKQLAVLEVSPDDSIGAVKIKLRDVHPKLYPSRVSFREASTKSPNLNDNTKVSELNLEDNKLYYKDLGPQVGWTTVFLTEYAGPLIIYLILYSRPPLIYGKNMGEPKNYHVRIAMICHTFHYAKRLFETVFIHRFSKGTMPIFNIFKNSIYYWGFAAWIAYYVNHPLYTPTADSVFYPALVAFGVCELGNLSIHLALRSLRPAGTRVRAIPKPNWNPFTWLFNFVSCPNYFYEVGAWISFSIMTSTLSAYIFTAAGFYQMTVWALGKHRNYRKEFKDYPRSRKAIIPFVI